ncbi:hypothetical protein [Nocardioides sp. GXZ039]|uniref:hypothetical protein n=1 Tax=Nocardioides sp. GXZ039 TaxID=3136018 RepID=UPI0030F3AF09
MSVQPTGAMHEVGVDQLFFSTTDGRGIITQANQVFTDLARLPIDALVGHPHNVVRHPEMPGAAFRIVWDMLQAGKPTCAYVKNLAGDGSTYWTFATMTPLGDGYLSVRSRPSAPRLQRVADDLYAAVLQGEQEERNAGVRRAEAAEHGSVRLVEGLAPFGFETYEEFIRQALPAEVAARTSQSQGLPPRPGATGKFGLLLDLVGDVARNVAGLGLELTAGHGLADELVVDVARARDTLDDLAATIGRMSAEIEAVRDRTPALALTAPKLAARCERVAESLNAVQESVLRMRDLRAELRFSVALAQLQSEAMGQFVLGVIDGLEDEATTDHALESLAAALRDGLRRANEDLGRDSEAAVALHDQIVVADEEIARTRLLLNRWREMAAADLQQTVPQMDAALAALGAVEDLTRGTERLAQSTIGFDADATDGLLSRVERLAATRAVPVS